MRRSVRSAVGLLLGLLATGCADRLLGPSEPRDRAAVFDELWQQFDRHYPYFELKAVDWDAIGGAYRPRALSARTDAQFATTLAGMLAELRDVHVTLTATGVTGSTRYLSRCDTAPAYFDPGVVFARYVRVSFLTPGRHLRYGMAADSVGYVQVPSFDEEGWATSEIDAALAELPNARALIMDVRNNRGGSVDNATKLAGRFADRSRVFGYLRLRDGPAHSDYTGYIAEQLDPTPGRRYAGPVFVLSNRRSFSSAEDFILAVRVQPRVTVVGDTTAGASGGPVTRQLPNGWTYDLPQWIAYTADRTTYEGVGLPPQVPVRPTRADSIAARDPVLERAILLARAAARS